MKSPEDRQSVSRICYLFNDKFVQMSGGGGGFILDAIKRFNANRSQRTSARGKFKGNYSEDTLLKAGGSEKIEFPELPKEQVVQERERIRVRHEKRKRNRIWILSIAFMMVALIIGVLYVKTQGFEYWDSVLPYD